MNPLDLNNLPEEYGKQALEESSTTTVASADTTRFKKKKNGGRDDAGKVYECRFCSLKFCKSQALGGHMNRHRQERETETLNRARQLVFSNEGLAAAGAHLGFRDLNVGASAQGFQHRGGGIGDQCLQMRPVYPRLPTQLSPRPSIQQYIYPSSTSHPIPFPSTYPQPHHPSIGDYYIGHVLPSSTSQRPPNHPNYGVDSNYPCFGAPLTHGFPVEGVRAPMARDSGSTTTQAEGRNWDCGPSIQQFRDDEF